MSPSDELILSIRSVLTLLSAIPGLWMAGRVIRRAGPWLAERETSPGRMRQLMTLALWLGLGGLFTAPLIDILCSFILTLAPSSLVPRFSLMWGEAPYRLHIILTSLLLVCSYALGICAARALFRALQSRHIPQQPPSAIEGLFCLLVLGSLVNAFTKILVGSILDVHIPSLYGAFYNIGLYGTTGYAAGWVIAIAALALVTLFLGSRLVGTQGHGMQ